MKLDVTVTVFTVSPIADPARGGRWCSVQFWRDEGTVRVAQLCDFKWRLLTPDGRDPQPEIDESIRAVLAILRDGVVDVPREDTLVIDSVVDTEV